MPTRKILTYGHPTLRKKTAPIQRVSEDIRKLISDMIQTMEENMGLGLAAPQIGYLHRVIVASVEEQTYVLINPKITKRSREKEIALEGCLSLPRLYADVERHQRITVTAKSRAGKSISLEAKDMLARVLQHEIDHLAGVLITDKYVDNSLRWMVSSMNDEGEETLDLLQTTIQEVENHFRTQRTKKVIPSP